MNVPKRLRQLPACCCWQLKSIWMTRRPYVGMSGQQMDNMLNQAQAISLDFNDRPVLVDGKIMGFMGFNFIHSERLLTNAAPARASVRCGSSPACVRLSGRT